MLERSVQQRPIVALLVAALAAVAGCGGSDPVVKADAGAKDRGPLVADQASPTPDGAQPDAPASDAALPDAPAPQPTSFTFFAFGDTRSDPAVFKKNVQSMIALDPAAIALFNDGDLTATGAESLWGVHDGVLAEGGQGKIRLDLGDWQAGALRYVGVIGNHDITDGAWFANWNKHLPGQQALGVNAKDGIYFALTHENALFIVLDSHHSATPQTAWLKKTLAAAGPEIKWRFVFFHRPVYPCNAKTPYAAGIPWVRELEQHKVDIAFVADSHTYERTCPMIGGKCADGGVVYLNSSGGGAPVRDVLATKAATVGTDSYHCAEKNNEPGILAKGIGNWHHYCHIEVTATKVGVRCFSHDKTTDPQDSFAITKS